MEDDEFYESMNRFAGVIAVLVMVVMLAIVGVGLWAVVRLVEHFT